MKGATNRVNDVSAKMIPKGDEIMSESMGQGVNNVKGQVMFGSPKFAKCWLCKTYGKRSYGWSPVFSSCVYEGFDGLLSL